MQLIEIITSVLGGLNIVQFLVIIRTMNFQVKKEKALAEKEKANSVEASQHIFDLMTERVRKELEEVYKKMGQQDQEILMMRKLLNGYKNQCKHCTNNKIQE